MNIWFLLWVFLAIFILGLFAWSFHILLRQKMAWESFAKKYSLKVTKYGLFKSNAVTGMFKGYNVYIYSEEQSINQNGTRRYRTIIQFDLPAPMPAPGIIASAEAGVYANSLGLKEELVPDSATWNPALAVRTDHPEKLKTYFTEERIKSLNSIMGMKTIASILIFDDKNTYLRFETPDAFDSLQKLERFTTKTAEHAKILSV